MELTHAIQNLDNKKKYLLAISGGLDSMVLFHLFLQSGLTFIVAHCNFQLREEQSDLDEQLVKDCCEKNHVEFFTRRFDTLKLKKNRESVEMIARNLRYEYFKELIEIHQFDYLVTAHHLNDNVETFFINLLRGSGLKGLSGMQPASDRILRPLLPFTRKEILDFAVENKIIWREDATNQTLDYLRNKIRHQVVSVLEEINPVFLHQAEKSMEIIHSSYQFIEKKVNELKQETFISIEGNAYIFSYEKIKKSNFILVYHFLSQYGFTDEQDCQNIIKAKTGSVFQSKTHTIWINRDQLIVENLTDSENFELNELIKNVPFQIETPVCLKIISSEKPSNDEGVETVDFKKVSFPLTLRNWKEGDFFYPINGKGKKKISKYLKDEKVSNSDKKKVLVLCDASGAIIWLVDFRLDDRFKISNRTTKYLILKREKSQ